MKKIKFFVGMAIIATSLILGSCEEEILAPNEDGLYIRQVAGVQVTFGLNDSTITVCNNTDERTTVYVYRWDDFSNDWLRIQDFYFYSYGKVVKHAVFSPGNFIRIDVVHRNREIPPDCFILGE
jgi:hypothetical protein